MATRGEGDRGGTTSSSSVACLRSFAYCGAVLGYRMTKVANLHLYLLLARTAEHFSNDTVSHPCLA